MLSAPHTKELLSDSSWGLSLVSPPGALLDEGQWPQRRWPRHFRADLLPCLSPALRTLHPRVPGSLALVPQLALLETLLGGGRGGSR